MNGMMASEMRPGIGLLDRVSWRVILATALATIATSGLLWLFGGGLALLATTHDSLEGGFVAMAAIAVVVTLIAAAVGGLVAGRLLGERIGGGLNAVLGCALAFVLVTGVLGRIAGGVLQTGGTLAVGTAQTSAATATVSGHGNPSVGAVRFLEGLGYSPAESHAMVNDGQRSVKRSANPYTTESAQLRANAADALNTLLHNLGALFLIYMGTWMVALLVAGMAGAESEKLLERGRSLTLWRRRHPHEQRRVVTTTTTTMPSHFQHPEPTTF